MPSRIPLAELARLPSFYLPTASWSGDKIAFYWDKTGRMELYVLDLHSRAVRQISHGEVPRALRAGFAWDSSLCDTLQRSEEICELSTLYRYRMECC